MLEPLINILNTHKDMCDVLRDFNLNESLHVSQYDPYKFFSTNYSAIFSNYKSNPSNYNKGRLQTMWDLMVGIIGSSRANTIRSRAETDYAKSRK